MGDDTTSRMEEDSRTEKDDGDEINQPESTDRDRIVDEITDVLGELYGDDTASDDEKADEE